MMQGFVRVAFSRRLSDINLLMKLIVDARARPLHFSSNHCTSVDTLHLVNGGPIKVAKVSTVPETVWPAGPASAAQPGYSGRPGTDCTGTLADIGLHQRLLSSERLKQHDKTGLGPSTTSRSHLRHN